MKKTAIVAGVASLCLAGTAGGAAIATTHHTPAITRGGLTVKVSPTRPSPGQSVKATLTGARKGVGYVCIEGTFKKGVKLSASDGYTPSAVLNIKAHHGKASCNQVYLPFTTPSGHHCPPTKKDKKAGWGCGVAFADPKHRTHYSYALYKF
jgi:hypothetical protein